MLDDKQKEQILLGRKMIDAHRIEHAKLYTTIGIKDIPNAHTPLTEAMLKGISEIPFKSLDEFFDMSMLFNVQELGYETKESFGLSATIVEKQTLKGMWK